MRGKSEGVYLWTRHSSDGFATSGKANGPPLDDGPSARQQPVSYCFFVELFFVAGVECLPVS